VLSKRSVGTQLREEERSDLQGNHEWLLVEES
jgi:hypothetical protein